MSQTYGYLGKAKLTGNGRPLLPGGTARRAEQAVRAGLLWARAAPRGLRKELLGAGVPQILLTSAPPTHGAWHESTAMQQPTLLLPAKAPAIPSTLDNEILD